VLVVGSLNADLTIPVERLPARGETVLGGDTTTGPGGKGGNQAVAAARLGTTVAMVGAVGDDGDGRSLIDALDSGGVDATGVGVVDRPTGRAVVALEPDGSNAIIVSPGANAALTIAHVGAHGATIASAAVVLAQLEVPTEAIAAAFGMATGITVLNPAPARPGLDDLLSECAVVVPNQTELALLTGADGPPATPAAAVDLARRLAGPSRTVVVTLGASGAVVVGTGAEPVGVPAAPARVVDTTGAGDAFCGALASGLARGLDLVSATELGVAAGAIAVGHPGALPPQALAELGDRLPSPTRRDRGAP